MRPWRFVGKKKPQWRTTAADFLSGREDLNLRPPGPEPGALPGCATPREAAQKQLPNKLVKSGPSYLTDLHRHCQFLFRAAAELQNLTMRKGLVNRMPSSPSSRGTVTKHTHRQSLPG